MREGVVTLTRLALIACLVGSGGIGANKSKRLKATTIANTMLYCRWPELIALAIRRKASEPKGPGLFRYLSPDDVQYCNSTAYLGWEIARIDMLVSRGLWSDAPALLKLARVTDPARMPSAKPPARETAEYQPLPDEWLAKVGPRVLWVVRELAPNLLALMERLPTRLKDVEFSKSKTPIYRQIRSLLCHEMERQPWLDSAGQVLIPPFRLITGKSRGGKRDPLHWPPITWEQIVMLSTLVQAAHLFLVLLGTAGRIGEVLTLKRNCVEQRADGELYVSGRTYKLTPKMGGEKRSWPAPEGLVLAIGQQSRFALAWDWLPIPITDGLPTAPRFDEAFWVSIGPSGTAGNKKELDINRALIGLAKRLDVDTKPGGIWLHAHRFRKTIGRLAGVALWNSPLVLKQLFGHKDIEMTLHYILADSAVRKDAEKVLRELRVMHCADTIQQIRDAVKAGRPNPFGGRGAARMQDAISDHEGRLAQVGTAWDEETAYEVAVEMTMKGMGWRLSMPGVVCDKLPHEDGLCRKGASRKGQHGEPDVSQCKHDCVHRIVLATKRRDDEQNCEKLLAIAQQACAEGLLLVAEHSLQNLMEILHSWPDLHARYHADPAMQAVMAALDPEAEKTIEVTHA